MSYQNVITFPTSGGATIIAPDQAVAANANLVLNYTDLTGAPEGDPSLQSQYVIPGFAVNVDLNSASDLSGVNFIFHGFGLINDALTETLAGPNNAAVTTVHQYHIITSITADDTTGADTVIATTGETGVSQWLKTDINRNSTPNTSIQVVITGTSSTYTVNGTLDKVETMTAQGNVVITPTVFPIANLNAANTNKLVTFVGPYAAYQLDVTASEDAKVVMTVIQQGIT